MAAVFHELSDRFIEQLAAEAKKGGWWADVLADRKLVIALRGSYLNVYWHGQSLFLVKSRSTGLTVTTHEKYLLDPKLTGQVTLTDGKFEIENLSKKGFIRDYEGPTTLEKMKKAARLFSGREKTGCHAIAIGNSGFIDCEIAFPGKVSTSDSGQYKQAPQADLASLEAHGNDEARLVFWEAKHYWNHELRAESGPPPVLGQVKIYEKCVSEKCDVLKSSYTKVAANLLAIKEMGWKRELSPLIKDVGTGKRRLILGEKPKVGLLIFGFDNAAKKDPIFKTHLKRLTENIRTLAVGDPKGLHLPL